MWPLIITLVALGLVLILVEVFIPGMIVGVMGFTSLVAATVLCYMHHGRDAGNWLLFGELIFGAAFVGWWLTYLPKTPLARKWTLKETVTAQSPGEASVPQIYSIGQSGTAETQLRPAGLASIGGSRVDVVTAGELIESGEAVVISRVEGNRIVVRRAPASPQLPA